MIPAAFDYVRAGSAEEAISLLGEHGDEAKFLAGGHSLLPLMKLRLAQPSVLVDIGRLTRPVVHPRRRRPHRHRRADPAPRRRDVRRARRARAAAEHAAEPRRRPAGAPPRHDRRLDRPRRPGLRPAGHDAGARRHVRRPGPERHPGDRRRRLLRELPHVHAGRRRAAHRDPRPEDAGRRLELPEVQPAGPGLGDRRRRRLAAQRRRRRRPRQHGLDADPRHERRRRRSPAVPRSPTPPSRPPPRPTRRPTSTPASSTAPTSPRCSPAAPSRPPAPEPRPFLTHLVPLSGRSRQKRVTAGPGRCRRRRGPGRR